MSHPFFRLLTFFIVSALTIGALAQDVPPVCDDTDTESAERVADWSTAFSQIRPDPHPESLTRNSHYFVSDEKRHDLFRDAIANQGGIFIGLGPDQNYLMAAWARPEILIPLDFDQMIVHLHYAYRVAFLNAKNPDEFISLWTKKRFDEMADLIKNAYPDDPKFRKGVLRAHKNARKNVHARLKRIRRAFKKLNVTTYLSDMEQYTFIVELFEQGRVFPVRGDLTADKTINDIAKAAAQTGLKIKVLYLSNAEQYFKYSNNNFKQNMLALPFDHNSVIIRTAGMKKKWSADGMYEYIVQSASNFQMWMRSPKTYSVWRMINQRDVDKKTGGSVIKTLPPAKELK